MNQKSQFPMSACGCNTDHHNGETISTVYKKKRIYFCASDCKNEFEEDPKTFLESNHFILDFEMLEDE